MVHFGILREKSQVLPHHHQHTRREKSHLSSHSKGRHVNYAALHEVGQETLA